MTKPKLRFKEFNDDWNNLLLKEFCIINPNNNKTLPNTFFYIDLESVINGQIAYKLNAINKDNAPSRAARILQVNDLLYQTVRPYQRNNYLFSNELELPTVASTGYAQIRTTKNSIKFLYQLIHTDTFVNNVMKRCTGTSYPAINSTDLSNIIISVPNIYEQEKIAGFLSKVDELINECEGEVKDLEEQKKGLMQKIFSQQIRFKDSNKNPYPDWEEHCINEFIISLKSGLSRELQNEDIGIPVIRANNTYNGIVGGNDIKYWYKKDPKGANIDNYVLDDGDILINFINSLPRMGEAAIFTNFLNRPCIYTTNLLRLKLNNKLNYKYFFYYTKTSEYINYIKAITKPAVNQASFTTVDFKNLKLLLPCQEEQEKIAKVLSKMDDLIEEKKALLSDWQQFKKGLLQQMFV